MGGGVLVQFSAGRCTIDNSSNRVAPSADKGTVSVSKVEPTLTARASLQLLPRSPHRLLRRPRRDGHGKAWAVARGLVYSRVPPLPLPACGRPVCQADGMTTFQWSNRESGEQDDVSRAC